MSEFENSLLRPSFEQPTIKLHAVTSGQAEKLLQSLKFISGSKEAHSLDVKEGRMKHGQSLDISLISESIMGLQTLSFYRNKRYHFFRSPQDELRIKIWVY